MTGQFSKARLGACVSALALALGGCSFESAQPVPKLEVPTHFQNDAGKMESNQPANKDGDRKDAAPPGPAGKAVDGLPRPQSRWWQSFHIPELDSLVNTALTNNHDLKAAVHRIAEAEAQAGVQAGALLPNLSLSASANNSSPYGGVGTRYTTNPTGTSARLYQIGPTISYETDFWGKNRASEDSALASAKASLYDRETLAQSLVGQVVTAYLNYLSLCDRLEVAHQNVDNMSRVLKVVELRRAIGAGADIEIRQQATALAQAQATIPPLALQKEQLRTELAILTGHAPEGFSLKGTTLKTAAFPPLPGSLPSELLSRRPDLRSAAANLVAADANIAQAKAQLLPDFTLSAERGVGSPWLAVLFSPASYFYSVTAGMTQTIFDNGKSISQVDYAKEVYGEKIENYRQALLTALRDVENSLAAVRLTQDLEVADARAAEQATAAYSLSQKAFRIGNADYLTILDVERTSYQTEDALVQARYERLNAMATLYQSLGGGTETATAEPQPGKAAKAAPAKEKTGAPAPAAKGKTS
ncbi:toluene efflux pump outer membrane protein TtgI precursor [mine drainage metagenome]|uniref:Toluene efflux pump outer membrane protein TtgI n=1 Tax=mine drainage metagenome TaxID=410659 RepID=A0A1J5RII8_9ZZZZ